MYKYSHFKLRFTVVFILLNINSFSQENKNSYGGSIIAGTNRRFDISLLGQSTIKAKILSFNDSEIKIRENGRTYDIDRSSITNIKEIPFGTRGNIGVGFGIPYGLLGFNLELNPLPYIGVTGGFGTTIFSGIGYNVGVKTYFRKSGPVWRPRVSVYYGINAIYADDFNDPDNKKYSGVTLGIGQLFIWQQHGFDLDLMYIATSEIPEELYEGGNIKISIGYKYAF